MNMKKIVSGALCAALLAGTLSGCGLGRVGSVNNGEVNMNTDQTEFHVVGDISALSSGYDDNPVLNEMAEAAGIKIDWEVMSDSLGEQVNIRITGGDLPDAFQGVGFSNYDLARYGRGGTFLDLTPYITPEIMPNLYKILEENPSIKAAITQDDGGIYGLPAAEMMGTGAIGAEDDISIHAIQQFSMINKRWLDELNLPVPETVEELKTALQAFKDNDMSHKVYGNDPGTTIPMTFGFDQWCWGQNIFYAPFGVTNWSDVCMDLRLTKDKQVVFDCVSDEYRDAVTYYHDWYQEGLIDLEVFSQTDTQYISKCTQGYVGVATWWEIAELTGDYAGDYVYLPPLKGPDGRCTVTLKSAGSAVNSGQLSITDEEAQAQFGKSAGELKGASEVQGPKLILSDYYTDVFHMEDRAVQRLKDLENFWFNYVEDKTIYPVDCVFNSEELDTIDLYRSDFENAVKEQEALWLRDGGPTDEEWEEYKTYLSKKCGMDKLIEAYQGAYERYAAAE